MQLGTVSFTLGGAEPVAFAVYSDDDKSLNFYKRLDVPEVGDTFEGKTVTKVYTGIETDTYVSRADVPWADHKADIVKVEAVDRIQPVSMARWFDMAKIENPKVTEVDLSKVSTGACKSIFCLFQKAKSLRRIDGLQNWDTSSCTTMKAAFSNCSALQSIDVSNWNTSKASDLSYLFRGCSSLQSLDVSGWNTSSCTDMNSMFRDCMSLESLDVSRWDTSKVTTFQFMFAEDVANKYMKLRTVGDLSGWNTSNVTDMCAMFQECGYLESIGDISGWNTAKVIDMNGLFNCCVRLGGIGDLSGWNTSNVTDMDAMFQDCEYLKSIGDISNWNTSKVTNMDRLFNHCVRLNDIGNLSRWDTSSCTNMYAMFRDCLSLGSLDLSGWNTSKVTTFTGMFATSGNQYMKLRTVGDLSGWNTSNVTDMDAMFQDCEYLESIGDISGWNTSKVTSMRWLFNRCVRLNGIGDLSRWDVSHCTGFDSMFRGEGMTKTGMDMDVSFVKVWDVRSATDIAEMFIYCTAQEELDLSGWDISSVKDMSRLFDGMTGLRKISLPASWKWIGSEGTAGYLPTPSASSIPGADGKWYSTTTGIGYAPADIPSGKADTYVASKELLPKVAFAVYSADDQSLDFYKRFDVPEAGDTFNGKTVTKVYTGFEEHTYGKIGYTHDVPDNAHWTALKTNVPWFDIRDEVSTIKVIDSGVAPKSLEYWFYRFSNLKSADLSNLETSHITSIFYLFVLSTNLTSIKMPGLTSACTDYRDSFSSCPELISLEMPECDFSGCNDFFRMFNNSEKLKIDCSDWNVPANALHDDFNRNAPGVILPKPWQSTAFAVFSSDDKSLNFYKREFKDMPKVGDTFEGKTVTDVYTGIETTRYTPIDYNDSNGATNVPWYSRSSDCKNVSVVDNGIKPNDIAFWFHRFKNCISFDVSKLDTSSVSCIEHIFYDCENVKNLDLSTWDLSHCESAVSAFAYCYNLESIEFGSISTANFKSYGCYWMFSDCSKLSLDCSEWVIDPSAIQYAFNSGAPNVIPPKTWK